MDVYYAIFLVGTGDVKTNQRLRALPVSECSDSDIWIHHIKGGVKDLSALNNAIVQDNEALTPQGWISEIYGQL
jgi:hypothetical protein